MILCRVEGSVVATKKNPKMTGQKFLVVRPLVIDSPSAKELKPGAS
ncbi:MAG: EutN/CcmL family microcompartment protein, partial [Verrucomicrobiota bacterium]